MWVYKCSRVARGGRLAFVLPFRCRGYRVVSRVVALARACRARGSGRRAFPESPITTVLRAPGGVFGRRVARGKRPRGRARVAGSPAAKWSRRVTEGAAYEFAPHRESIGFQAWCHDSKDADTRRGGCDVAAIEARDVVTSSRCSHVAQATPAGDARKADSDHVTERLHHSTEGGFSHLSWRIRSLTARRAADVPVALRAAGPRSLRPGTPVTGHRFYGTGTDTWRITTADTIPAAGETDDCK